MSPLFAALISHGAAFFTVASTDTMAVPALVVLISLACCMWAAARILPGHRQLGALLFALAVAGTLIGLHLAGYSPRQVSGAAAVIAGFALMSLSTAVRPEPARRR